MDCMDVADVVVKSGIVLLLIFLLMIILTSIGSLLENKRQRDKDFINYMEKMRAEKIQPPSRMIEYMKNIKALKNYFLNV